MRGLRSRGRQAPSALGALLPEELFLSAPHAIFDLGVDDLAAGRGLEAARPGGWRYLVASRGGAVSAAEIGAASDSAAQVNSGPFVAATELAMAAAEALPAVVARDHEPRLLRVVALHLMALWLKSDDPSHSDLVIPLPPSPPFVTPGKPYPAGELLEALREPARLKSTKAYHR